MKEMIPSVFNKNFERIAELDNFRSFIWTSRYYTPGDFEVTVDASVLSYIEIGYYIARRYDYSKFGIIESIKVESTEERDEIVILSGRLLPSILGRRIISSQTVLNDTISNVIETLLNQNLIDPEDESRKIENVEFISNIINNPTIEVQYTGENLLDTISTICETYGIGIDMYYDNGDLKILLFKGADRSYDQSTNPYIVFSDSNDNLLTSDFKKDCSDYATDVLVGGEGEGTSQTMVWSAEESKNGLDRYEIYLDASSAVTNDHIITQETYENQLFELGVQEISNHKTKTEAFSGTVDFTGVEFERDVFIGDIVTIKNDKWGLSMNSRLVEVIESIGEDGTYTAVPTFGN